MEGVAPLISPKEIKVKDRNGNERLYIISLVPATYSMEIITRMPPNLLPSGNYETHQEMIFKMMSYTASVVKDRQIRLTTRDLIDNHTDFISYAQIIKEMTAYNWNFFFEEEFSNFGKSIIQTLKIWLSQVFAESFRQSLKQEKQPSTN